ncbi:MAG: prepilin-type N-terminal cleavage/methylation domain-containing protein [Chthoniobacteraceae bacterium]
MAPTRRSQRGIILFEVMIAVAIFALAVLALAQSVDNCIHGQIITQDEERARQFLANRMAEIEAGAVPLSDSSTEDLKDAYEGMNLKTTRTEIKKKNEKEEDIRGIFLVTLELEWELDGDPQSRSLQFYHFPRAR